MNSEPVSTDDEVHSDYSSVSSEISKVSEGKSESPVVIEELPTESMGNDTRLTSVLAKQDSRKWFQIFAVVLHSTTFACVTIFALLFFIPLLRPLLVIYFIYIYFSKAGQSGDLSNRSHFLRSLPLWDAFASYFPAALHRTAVLDPTQKYIFGYSPHGIICHGAFIAFCTEALGFSELFPGITNTLVLIDMNLRLPIYREYALRMGLRGVSRTSCRNILEGGPGRAVTIAIGGARESLLARPGTLRLVMNKRDGFIKLAIETGSHLVPVIGFGENDLYGQMDIARYPQTKRAQVFMKNFLGWTLPLFYGKAIFGKGLGLLAFPKPLNIVVGKPIEVKQQSIPDADYVRELHARYVEGLTKLWEDHKDKFAPDSIGELEFV